MSRGMKREYISSTPIMKYALSQQVTNICDDPLTNNVLTNDDPIPSIGCVIIIINYTGAHCTTTKLAQSISWFAEPHVHTQPTATDKTGCKDPQTAVASPYLFYYDEGHIKPPYRQLQWLNAD